MPIISIVRILAGGKVQYSGAVYPEIREKNENIENVIFFFPFYLDSRSYDELTFENMMIEDVVKSIIAVLKSLFLN